jgi:proteasome accessory factor B
MRRMLAFRQALLGGAYPSASTLAGQFEVTVRTAQRDIEYLRDQLGWALEYDPARRGYRAAGPLPMADAVLTEGDLLAVLVALPLVASYRGTAYGRRLKAVFERLCAGLSGEVEVRLAELDQALSARGTSVPLVDADVLEAWQDGIREHRSVGIVYRTRSRGGERTEREVDPYHLCCVDGQWYGLGYCHLRREVRSFAAWRIERAELTERRFERPADFDATRYFANAFRVFCGRGKERVVLMLSGLSAALIQERPVPTEEGRRVMGDGRLELALRPSSLEELQWWVLGFGGECQVVRPRKLREMIRRHAERMVKASSEGKVMS